MKKYFLNNWQLIGILLVYLCVALYQLDSIPGEIWGDAISHYNLAEKVLHGGFFYDYEFGGDGPIFTYLAVAVSYVTHLSFYSLKLTSVIIGFFFVLSMYFLAKEFFKEKTVALLSAFISGISFWTLVFAKQPHARILVPLFICLTLIYTLKKKNIVAGIFLGLGMYTQASFWGMILTYWRNWKTLLIGVILTIPLIFAFIYNPVSFFSKDSYFGEKLAVHTPFTQDLYAFFYNVQANLLSFNVKGDSIFRMNIPHHPHLDVISGLLFVFGFLFILVQSIRKKQKEFILYFILPFFFIQVPSFLDIHNYFSQPNISRMIGVIPFVYMSVAYGIFKLNELLTKKIHNQTAREYVPYFMYIGLPIFIFILNFYNYFYIFPLTLPNSNTPFGKLIAEAIDDTTPQTHAIIIGAGWGQYVQPEVAGIPMVQTTVHQEDFFQTVDQTTQSLCQTTQHGTPILIASNPAFASQLQSANMCINKTKSYMLRSNGWDVAYIIEGVQK